MNVVVVVVLFIFVLLSCVDSKNETASHDDLMMNTNKSIGFEIQNFLTRIEIYQTEMELIHAELESPRELMIRMHNCCAPMRISLTTERKTFEVVEHVLMENNSNLESVQREVESNNLKIGMHNLCIPMRSSSMIEREKIENLAYENDELKKNILQLDELVLSTNYSKSHSIEILKDLIVTTIAFVLSSSIVFHFF